MYYVSLKIYSFGVFDEIKEECGWFQDSRSGISLISILTGKMPMRCTEHQDLVGERMNDRRPYVQMWRGVQVNCHSFLPIRQI